MRRGGVCITKHVVLTLRSQEVGFYLVSLLLKRQARSWVG